MNKAQILEKLQAVCREIQFGDEEGEYELPVAIEKRIKNLERELSDLREQYAAKTQYALFLERKLREWARIASWDSEHYVDTPTEQFMAEYLRENPQRDANIAMWISSPQVRMMEGEAINLIKKIRFMFNITLKEAKAIAEHFWKLIGL